jgi:cephalosporin-C deacetylase
MLSDLPLDELRDYRPRLSEPPDFDQFWAKTLAEAREHELDARFEPVETGLTEVTVHDVTFSGYGGHPIKGWFVHPAGARGPLPTVVQYIGYGGGRGLPHSHLTWAAAGFAHFVMDTRGQGSATEPGDTPDPVGAGPAYPGYMTRGVLDPYDYYYRRVFTDGVRAVEAARSHPLVDPSRMALTGGSQGGAITLAVGGLVPDLAAIAPDVPFLCDFRRAVRVCDLPPYREIAWYLKTHRGQDEEVFRTLSYFDCVHFAARGRAPALFSTALEDQVCPPSTVFAAFNAYAGEEKHIEVYTFNDHEGGGPFQQAAQLRWLPPRLRVGT